MAVIRFTSGDSVLVDESHAVVTERIADAVETGQTMIDVTLVTEYDNRYTCSVAVGQIVYVRGDITTAPESEDATPGRRKWLETPGGVAAALNRYDRHYGSETAPGG